MLSGIIVLCLCFSSASTLLLVWEIKAATTAPLLLIIAPLDGSQNKLPSEPKYIRRVSLIFPGESSQLQALFQDHILVPASMRQALKHTPQGTGRAVLSPGKGTANRQTQVCTGIMHCSLLPGNNVGTAQQMSGRYSWWLSFCRRGETALLPQNVHETLRIFCKRRHKMLRRTLASSKAETR